MMGFSLLWGSLRGLAPSSRWILWELIRRLIPFMSAMVHPSADLCFLNKLINFTSWSTLSLEERMIGKVSPGPKNACFSPSGSGDNLTFGDSKSDGFSFSFSLGNSSKRGYQNCFCLSCVS